MDFHGEVVYGETPAARPHHRDTHRRAVLIIHLSVFFAAFGNTRLRRVIIAIMRPRELVTRIVCAI